MVKPLIVGYDPGTTAALAIVDTSKNIVYLRSKREFKKKELVEAIVKRGKPIIVAGDRSPLSGSVEKLASSLGCKAFEPPEDLSNLEKYNLVKNYLDVVKNDHERDALASALKAYKNYSKLFKKTDKAVSYLGLGEFYDKILRLLIEEEVKNINEAVNAVLNEIREKKEKFVVKKKMKTEKITPKEIEKLREMIRGQKNDIKILKNYNETLKKRLEEVDKNFKDQKMKNEGFHDKKTIKENRRLYKLENKLEKKGIVIEKLKVLRKLENKGYIPIIDLGIIKPDKVVLLDSMLDFEGRVISIESFVNIQILNDYKIQALIVPSKPDKEILERVNFPIIFDEELNKEEVGEITVAKKKEFDEKLKKARKRGIIQWINGHKKRRL